MSTKRAAMAMAVDKIFRDREWTWRDAMSATGLSNRTLYKLRRGGHVYDATLVKWARAVGEDPDEWIALYAEGAVGQVADVAEAEVGDELVDAVCRALARQPPSDPVKRHWMLQELERIVEYVAQP